jgi:hypothetical protein
LSFQLGNSNAKASVFLGKCTFKTLGTFIEAESFGALSIINGKTLKAANPRETGKPRKKRDIPWLQTQNCKATKKTEQKTCLRACRKSQKQSKKELTLIVRYCLFVSDIVFRCLYCLYLKIVQAPNQKSSPKHKQKPQPTEHLPCASQLRTHPQTFNAQPTQMIAR